MHKNTCKAQAELDPGPCLPFITLEGSKSVQYGVWLNKPGPDQMARCVGRLVLRACSCSVEGKRAAARVMRVAAWSKEIQGATYTVAGLPFTVLQKPEA